MRKSGDARNDVKDYMQELVQIKKVAKYLRSLRKGKETSWEEAAEWHLKYANLNGDRVLALTITLSPTGCEWAKQGGCTMCGEYEGAYRGQLLIENPQFHIAQFASAIGNPAIWDAVGYESRPLQWLRINQEGNYTNTRETSILAQERILRLAIHIDGVKRITIESRPQYLNEANIASLAKIFAGTGVELEIGMGFEAQDDVIRNVCVNKHGMLAQFAETTQLLRRHGILPLAYVLLKPPFLTEHEAIEEAVKTVHSAVAIGFGRISFEPMSIHSYTVVDALAQSGDYKPPWLWSVVEVATRCADLSKVFGIGGVGFYPIPRKYAHNQCNGQIDCNVKVVEAILEYNASRDVSVFSGLTCSCKTVWEEECRIESLSPLKRRIQEQMERVAKQLSRYTATESSQNNVMRDMRLLASSAQPLS